MKEKILSLNKMRQDIFCQIPLQADNHFVRSFGGEQNKAI